MIVDLTIIRAQDFSSALVVTVPRVSHLYDVAMCASTVHQIAPGGHGAHFRIVHDAEPQFGSSIVFNLITIDLIRGVIGYQYIIGVITLSRRNQFQHTDCARLFFGEGASNDKRMTSFGDHNLSFNGIVRICSAWSYSKGWCEDLRAGLCHLKNWHNLNLFAPLSLYDLFPESCVFNCKKGCYLS